MKVDLSTLSAAQLKQIISIREKIDSLQAQLAKLVGGAEVSKEPVQKAAPKRRLSAAGKAAIAAAAKARWAKHRAAKKESGKKSAVKASA